MQRLGFIFIALVLAAGLAFAHGDAVHVRGTVTKIAGNSVTIQTADKPAKMVTFTVANHTEIDRGAAVATIKDLKIGERIVVELPKGKTEAESIKIAPVAAPASKR